MSKNECYLVGYISKTHGVVGEVSISLDSDSPNNYKKMESIFVEINKQLIPFFVKKVSIKGNNAFVLFEDTDTVEDAKELVGHPVYLPLKFLPELSANKFYYHEIIGFTVIDAIQGELGTIKDVLEFPQQMILEMLYKEKEVLIPLVDGVYQKINKVDKKIWLNIPEGLIEVYM
jgi:16S rRNA processing protein RimM